MKRESAKSIGQVIEQFIRSEGLEDGLLRVRIFEAWDIVVGENAARYTSKKFFKDGKLFCSIGSSVLRSQIYFQKEEILKQINSLLSADYVSDIILN